MRISKHSAARWTQLLATLFASLVLASCGGLQSGNGSGGGSNPVVGAAEVTVSPSNAVLRAGDGIQFTAAVKGAKDQSVTWTVNGVAGGNSTLGTVTATGYYTSPSTVPTPNSVQVEATSVSSTSSMSASAVTVNNPVPMILSMLPTLVPVGNFTISITGKRFVPGCVVVFGSNFLNTTYISPTQLSASGDQTTPVPGGVSITVLNPDPGSMASNAFLLQVGSSSGAVTAEAASRFLEQSTWGATPALIQHVQQVGFQTFLNEQYGATITNYSAPGPNDDMTTVQKRFFINGMVGGDQVRQRVAFALSEIMVASAVKVNDPNAFVLWQTMMQKDALGNYSTLLNDVTLSPVMGNYLDMANNDKPNPDAGTTPNENYAREVLQLFSIGLEQLNPDGTRQLDSSGQPIPTYDQDTIEGFAHVFTGWSYPPKPGSSAGFWAPPYYSGPMLPYDSHHDGGSKVLLNGTTLPPGGSATADLNAAIQNIFNHPNVGPFISKQLIQRLVTSNPSPAYVARVASVFNDNGSGVRGDMKAVVSAILLDGEARRGDDPTQAQAQDGKLKEPILFIMSLLKALNGTTDGDRLSDFASDMKQEPFFSPSVFNFFPPDFQIEGTNLLGPEYKILNTSTAIARINFVNTLVYGSVGSKTSVDLSNYITLAPNPDKMLDALATAMLHGNMSDGVRSTILSTISAIPDNTRRAKAAVYLVGSSTQFQVQH
jgi:uncharacterized protein (DUF1800 family)